MKTCYTCGNKADPGTYHGKRNLTRLGKERKKRDPLLDFHPLAHFGFCVRRHQWLEDSRVDCANWTHPCEFSANHVHVRFPRKLHRAVERAHKHRYPLTVAATSVGVAVALALTAWVSG